MYIMSVKNCKKIDNQTINEIGIPSIVLMENAASEITNMIKECGTKFLVVCGKGNNGGDGLAIARKLHVLGKHVQVIVLTPDNNFSEDFTTNITILKKIGCEIFYVKSNEDFSLLSDKVKGKDLIVDGIFGVGLKRTLDEFYCTAIDIINEKGKRIVSIDVPSGMDGETGMILGNAIKAEITYTFEVLKKGFVEYEALEYLGKVKVLSIGIPVEVKKKNDEGFYKLSDDEYRNLIPIRRVYGHKGDYGKAVIIAGSKGMAGAAYIATEACVKGGAGTTTLVTSDYVQGALSSKLVEAMTLNIEDEQYLNNIISNSTVIGIGPGIRKGNISKNILKVVLEKRKIPIVLDADGLNIVSESEGLLNMLSGRAIITPHPGEMARLINNTVNYVEKDRVSVAKEFANKYRVIVVLKGFNTIITDGQKVIVNSSGSSKMASGGMGDCLTGIITSYVSQGMKLFEAAILGSFIHGYVADEVGKNKYSVVATDIIENIQEKINKFLEK